MSLKIFKSQAASQAFGLLRKGQKSGMVLVFVIVVLLLIGLMGLVILSSTRSEVNISSNYRQSQDAFQATDSLAKLAVLLSRAAVKPVLGTPQDLLGVMAPKEPENPITVEINRDRFNLESLIEESDPFAYAERYSETSDLAAQRQKAPHLIFKVNGQVVGQASVTLDANLDMTGYSLSGSDRYDPSSGGNSPVDLVIVVSGTIARPSGQADSDATLAPKTVITAITRDLS
ncbi:MAG: hypothetical protein LBT38_04985 [Deltaproteobacteria bacterium]|jgi:type II secretory pathway pseudopilin PulG|nr:hypothetical protein [Deltaproteobacteria bacterium]